MAEKRIRLIAALGNPGYEYVKTRHNIAWQAIEYLDIYDQMNWTDKFSSEFASMTIESEKIYFIKPQTYMNRSGDGIAALMNYFKISHSEILVMHDELELDFGTVSLKNGGGLAGHNGLRSIAANLGTRDFYRYRLGISRPPSGSNITNYVLGGFTSEEQVQLPDYFEESARIIEKILIHGIGNYERKYKKFKTLAELNTEKEE